MVKEFKQGEIYETWNEENSGGLLHCCCSPVVGKQQETSIQIQLILRR